MKTPLIPSVLQYTRLQRVGLLIFFVLIATLQIGYYFWDSDLIKTQPKPEKESWLSLQTAIDTAAASQRKAKPKIYPFNPNFITDFKGYQLGLSVAEIDRLLEFRKTNRYVNSAAEFQQVTQVSDSLLQTMAPYFKFPDWVRNKKPFHSYKSKSFERIPAQPIDINTATKEDLKKVYGIGDGLSERILVQKEKLGGFVSMDQMNDVWGLSPEVLANLNKAFKVTAPPNVRKVRVNEATVKELMQFPYFRYALAKSIVTYRSMHGEIKGAEDLLKISGFPIDKIDIIALYLEF